MSFRLLAGVAAAALMSACTTMSDTADTPATAQALPPIPVGSGIFAQPSTLPFGAPDFTRIQDSDYQPAIEQGIAIKLAEVEHIARNPAAPTFENTIVALERTGQMLNRATAAFGQVQGANTNDTLDAVDSAVSPMLAEMDDAIYLNEALFARVKAVYDQRAVMAMTGEDAMLLDLYSEEFVHRGALLDGPAKAELRTINTRLSTLESEFGQKLTQGTAAAAVLVDTRAELAGLNDGQIQAAANLATERGHPGKFMLALINTTQQPLLAVLENRATREKLYNASINRTSSGGAFDTTGIVREVMQLRARKAQLMGAPDYATWQMYDRMAATPARAEQFLRDMVPAIAATQAREAEMLNERIRADGHNFTVQPWDWAFYAEKVRQERYNLDESRIRQYFEVTSVLENGVFYMAEQLYGLTFRKRTDIPVYHPDMTVYTVIDKDGTEMGLFYFDPFARGNKNGGAWMNNFTEQSYLMGQKPTVSNTLNIAPPAPGEPALASFDDVTTMFHEFGHALHGLFASQQYPSLSGTNTARDWVEFPSQFHENFATIPSVLNNYAKHYQTGETIPAELLTAIDRASKFDQGYAFGELISASLVDLEWHRLQPGQVPTDVVAFENAALARTGLNTALVPPRYRTPYFRHIVSNGYSAGYHAYQWTEMLHHDAYDYVANNGGMTRAMGDRIRATFLGQGHSKSYEQMYRDFTGRDPRVEPMLRERGLTD
jgi:peptidyl-dipeptidase Dcp